MIETIFRLEAAEMRFLRSMAGYRLIDHRRNEDIREELQIIDKNSRIEDYQIKWLQHLERMEQNRSPKSLLNYKPRGRRDQGRPCRTMVLKGCAASFARSAAKFWILCYCR
jgi:hypothetical protein